MSFRNRFAGAVALALGITIVAFLIVEGRWDNHDNVRPFKLLLGGFLFIGVGAWYLFRGAKAESWRNNGASPNQTSSENQDSESRWNLEAYANELERDPAFPAVYRKVEAEWREKARQMEKSIEGEKSV